jgi:hypothetical protein
MEADHKDVTSYKKPYKDMVNITQPCASLPAQITSQSNSLQEQIMLNVGEVSSDFQWVLRHNEDLKEQVWGALDNLRSLMLQQYNTSSYSLSIFPSPTIRLAATALVTSTTNILPTLKFGVLISTNPVFKLR